MRCTVTRGESVSISYAGTHALLECGFLRITKHGSLYWLCHGAEHLVLEKRIDRLDEWQIFARRWEVERALASWLRIRVHFDGFLRWCSTEGASIDIFLRRHEALLSWIGPAVRWKHWEWDTKPAISEIQGRMADVLNRCSGV